MLGTYSRVMADHRLAQRAADERDERDQVRLVSEILTDQTAADACDAEAESRLARARDETPADPWGDGRRVCPACGWLGPVGTHHPRFPSAGCTEAN